jgi:hypothetical protein
MVQHQLGSIDNMIKEYHQHIHHDHQNKSDVVWYSISLGHHIQLKGTNIFFTKSRTVAKWNMSFIPQT